MKYYLGEIYVTHRKVLFWYFPYPYKFTAVLVEAKDWVNANEKMGKYADKYMDEMKHKWKYKFYTTEPI